MVFAGIVLLHVGFVYTLNAGLEHQLVERVFGPIETKIIEETKDEEKKPPPPPPKMEVAPPPFVPPPDVVIDLPVETTATTAITATTKPVPKPVAAAPPPNTDKIPPRAPKRGLEEPEYPPQSKRLGEEGAVILRLYILEDGRVGDAQVATSSGFPRLDEAALKQAKRAWRFQPGTEGGKPVAMWFDFRVKFQIKTEKG